MIYSFTSLSKPLVHRVPFRFTVCSLLKEKYLENFLLNTLFGIIFKHYVLLLW